MTTGPTMLPIVIVKSEVATTAGEREHERADAAPGEGRDIETAGHQQDHHRRDLDHCAARSKISS